MRVLVTGGAGFIGSHLVEHHLNKGDFVIAVDNCLTGSKHNIQSFLKNPNFIFYHCDFRNWHERKEVIASVDRIYNMAAIVGMQNVLDHPIQTLIVNANICEELFKIVTTLTKKPSIFVASSSEVYGPQDILLEENKHLLIESANKSETNYPVSKIHNELVAHSFFKIHHVPCVIGRLFNTIGPRQTGFYGMVVPRFIQHALTNKPITVFGNGEQTRSFCDVRDLVVILDNLMSTPDAYGEIINIGSDAEVSINTLAKLVQRLSNTKSTIVKIPFEKAYHHSEEYVPIARRKPCLAKLKKLIDVQYQWSLETTIINLLEQGK